MIHENDSRFIDTSALDGPFLCVHNLRPLVAVNVNAGDNGKPKDAYVGGSLRMRVSSGSRKRAQRMWMQHYIADAEKATRTRMLPSVVAQMLVERGRDFDQALFRVVGVLSSLGAKGFGFTIFAAELDHTNEIAFVPTASAELIADIVNSHWDELDATSAAVLAEHDKAVAELEAKEARATSKSKAKTKKDDDKAPTISKDGLSVPRGVSNAVIAALAPGNSIEIALGGRMLTSLPSGHVEAAMAEGHSLSINPMERITDVWTVKDDWQDEGASGAAFFSGDDPRVLASGVMYEFSALDRRQLRRNLSAAYEGEALDLAVQCAEELFVASSLWVVASANSNSTASSVSPVFSLINATNEPQACPFYTAYDSFDAIERGVNRLLSFKANDRAVRDGEAYIIYTGETDIVLPEGVTAL